MGETPCRVEPLDPRRLLSTTIGSIDAFRPVDVPPVAASAAVSLAGGVLTVVGTQGDDAITGTVTDAGFVVRANGVDVGTFADFDVLHLWGYDGNDRIDVSGIDADFDVRVWIEGGAGDDMLVGSDRSDTLVGGDGDDELFGNGARDFVSGGRGNDVIFGGDDVDAIYGGRGNDAIVGGLGNDNISGGAGRDGVDYSGRSEAFEIRFSGRTEQSQIEKALGVEVVDDEGRVHKDLGTPDLYLSGSATTEAGERDTLGRDIENVLGGDGDDRFFGPARTVYFDGGRGRDTYFRNWLSDAEVNFGRGDRWTFVEEENLPPSYNDSAGVIFTDNEYLINRPFDALQVKSDLERSHDRIWAVSDREGGTFATLGPGTVSTFSRVWSDDVADAEEVAQMALAFEPHVSAAAADTLVRAVLRQMGAQLDAGASEPPYAFGDTTVDGEHPARRLRIADAEMGVLLAPDRGLSTHGSDGDFMVWLPLDGETSDLAGEGFLLPGRNSTYWSLDQDELAERLAGLGISGNVRPVEWFADVFAERLARRFPGLA